MSVDRDAPTSPGASYNGFREIEGVQYGGAGASVNVTFTDAHNNIAGVICNVPCSTSYSADGSAVTVSIGLGNGWTASTSLSYEVNAKKLAYSSINVSRDLHCWSMSASFVPFGPYKSYSFHIGVNASMLKDLKYDKNSADATSKRVNWW